jgi:hypothetical protein
VRPGIEQKIPGRDWETNQKDNKSQKRLKVNKTNQMAAICRGDIFAVDTNRERHRRRL